MSERKWTDEQLRAINTRGCNLLVSAASGAGKTAVLTERILSLITDRIHPVDIDRLLVVTFTNAAATEMRSRIAAAISARLAGEREDGRLGKQLVLLNKARITTIHSFCSDILRQYFYRLDLDPGFRIADETESVMLKADVLEDLFEKKYAGEPGCDDFTSLVESYGGERDDSGLQDLVVRLYEFSRSNPDPNRWLDEMAGKFERCASGAGGLDPYVSEVLAEVSAELKAVFAEMRFLLAMCRTPGGPDGYAGAIGEDMQALEKLIWACRAGWDEAWLAFREFRPAPLKKAGAEVDENLKEQVLELRNDVKKNIRAIRDKYLSRQLSEHAADMRKAAPAIRSLAELVREFGQNYRRAKLSKRLVDFNDLEHYCLRVLSSRGDGGVLIPSQVALNLREQYEEVLVDEYQDINAVQEAVIKLVSRPRENGPNLFMVGDVKQSIYRFRLADPGLFLEKYASYPETPGSDSCRINLSKNFRSRHEILDTVNHIFRQIMSREEVEIDYDGGAELVYGAEGIYGERRRPGLGFQVELYLLDKCAFKKGDNASGEDAAAVEGMREEPQNDAEDELPGEEDLAPAQAEARLAAGIINKMADRRETIYDSRIRQFRPFMYKDAVILLRSVRDQAGIFAEELERLGIPAYTDTGRSFLESPEVEIMVSLLRVIDNPHQDIPLAAVLRSPLVGLKAGDLAVIRMSGGPGDLWTALTKAAQTADGDLRRKLSEFIVKLGKWRDLGRRAPISELIWTLYRETGYYHYTGAMPGGAGRQANLRTLYDRAGQYEATTYRGIFSFLRYIDRLREKGEDPGMAGAKGENENVVRIMSIHKSKGLEFPVVCLAGLGKRFNMRDSGSNVVLHKDLGCGPLLVDTASRTAYPTLARLAAGARLRRESIAEEMRILYVAMTRAKEKLFLIGSADLYKSMQLWRRGGTGAAVLRAGTYLDWICPALGVGADGVLSVDRYAGGPDPAGREYLPWVVKFVDMSLLVNKEEKTVAACTMPDFAEAVRRGERVESNGPYEAEVRKRLNWRYPDLGPAATPVKVSVSGLTSMSGIQVHMREEGWTGDGIPLGEEAGKISFLKPIKRPVFMTVKKELTAAERGTAVHTAMSRLDLHGPLDAAAVSRQLSRMIDEEILTADQAAVVDSGKIADFFTSKLGKMVLSSKSVKREAPFSLLIPVEELFPDQRGRTGGGRVLVQGVVDCLVDDGGGYSIIDYKTDRDEEENTDGLKEKYGLQIKLYARAVESLTGRPVKAGYLYMFDSGRAVEVPLP